jgi:hypothetical protein
MLFKEDENRNTLGLGLRDRRAAGSILRWTKIRYLLHSSSVMASPFGVTRYEVLPREPIDDTRARAAPSSKTRMASRANFSAPHEPVSGIV